MRGLQNAKLLSTISSQKTTGQVAVVRLALAARAQRRRSSGDFDRGRFALLPLPPPADTAFCPAECKAGKRAVTLANVLRKAGHERAPAKSRDPRGGLAAAT